MNENRKRIGLEGWCDDAEGPRNGGVARVMGRGSRRVMV